MAHIGRTKNGKRWRVRYRDANAERFRATVVADMARGIAPDPSTSNALTSH